MKNKSGNNIHKDLEPVEPLITDIFNPKHQFAPFLAQTRKELIKNPIGRYYCTCTTPDKPEDLPVFYDDENKIWFCKDRYMDIHDLLLSFDKGSHSGSKTTNATLFKGTPANYVESLKKLDLLQCTTVGHKILETLADYIPRQKQTDAIIAKYIKIKENAMETLIKLNRAKNSLIKAFCEQFPTSELKTLENTIDQWIMRSKAKREIHDINTRYSLGWLCYRPGISDSNRQTVFTLATKFSKEEDIKRQMYIKIYDLLDHAKMDPYPAAVHISKLILPFGINDTPGGIKYYFPK